MQRDRELHVQTEEGKSTDLAKPTEPTSRLAEGIARGAAVVAGRIRIQLGVGPCKARRGPDQRNT